jgi:MFS family permease
MQPANGERAQGSWFSIILIYALGVLGATTVSQAISVAGDIVKFLHVPHQQAGWIISTPSALTAVGALLTGSLVDRCGDKRILIIGSLFIVAGDVGIAFAATLTAFLLMRVIEGLGYVCVAVSAVTMMMRITYGARRNIAMTLWSSFIPMSFALPLIMTSRLAGTDQWRWAFTGHAVVLAVLAVVALFALSAGGGETAPKRTTGLGVVLRAPGPYLLGLGFGCHAFIQTGIVSTLPHVLAHLYGLTLPVAASILTLGMVFNVIGCVVVGPMMNRGGQPLAIAAWGALGVLAGGIPVGLELPSVPIAILFACIFFFASGLVSGLWALLPQVAPGPQTRGATSGLVTQVTLFGVLLGPPAAFASQATGGWMRESVNIAVAGALMLVVLWIVIRGFARNGVSAAEGEPMQASH